ncbi:galactokinase family protein [soil metagenome]
MKDFGERLVAAGMSPAEAQRKVELFAGCAAALASLDASVGDAEPLAFFVPGRIEVLGKHTDYAGGRSLLCAMERGFAVLARPRADAVVRAVDVVRDETRELSLDSTIEPEAGDWSTYLSTVVRRVARDFPAVKRGMDIVFASDLPPASGMSSSSALVIAVFLALHAVNALGQDPLYQTAIPSREHLGEYLGAVENGRPFGLTAGGLGVGTLGGSQDQTAILCCRAGVLSRYAFLPVRAEGDVPFPAERVFVLAYSGVAAEKTASARLRYNEASQAVVEILALWNETTTRADGSLGLAVLSRPDAPSEFRAMLRTSSVKGFTSQRLLDRFDQFMAEAYDIIPAAADAFARGDLVAVGELVTRSQHGAESLLGNQTAETIDLVRMARALGADAASAFGAGFGGSVWALVDMSRALQFARDWRAEYAKAQPAAATRAEMIVTAAGPGAMEL